MALATAIASSGPSTRTVKPPSASVASMSVRRSAPATISAMASSTASATASSQVMSQARPPGPCSAWTTMSTAHSSAGTESSPTTTTSDGPANAAGTPTRPVTWRLACDT